MVIPERFAGGESDVLEFKEALPDDGIQWLKTVVAFSNTRGGRLVVGLDDHGHVVGVDEGDAVDMCQRINDAISDTIVPQVSRDVYIESVGEDSVIVVEVFPGATKPYYIKSKGVKDGTFVRIGASSRQADEFTLDELRLIGRRLSFDAIENRDVQVTTGRTEGIIDAVRRIHHREITERDLINCGIIRMRGDSKVATNAYALLCSDSPFIFVEIRCGAFRHTDTNDFLDQADYGVPLFDQIEEAYRFVLRNIRKEGRVNGLLRVDRYEIPEKAIREVLVNAVQHRSYINSSRPIYLAVYDDRVVVTSPGALLIGKDDMVRGRTEHRNPSISKFFRLIGLSEGWGNGMVEVMRSCSEYGLRDPVVESSLKDVTVTLWRPIEYPGSCPEHQISVDVNDPLNPKSDPLNDESDPLNSGNDPINPESDPINDVNDPLNPKSDPLNDESDPLNSGNDPINPESDPINGEDDPTTIQDPRFAIVLACIRENPGYTISEMSESTGIPYGTMKRLIRTLREEGILCREGSKKNGLWTIRDGEGRA